MTVTAEMIITRRGTVLPLDQRRRDALMNYAQQAADDAGVPRQSWARKTWDLRDYEAKDLLKGNSSEQVWERILKLRGPHCGYHVALPVMAAVIGHPVHEFFREQTRQAAREAERAEQHERLAATAYRTLAGGTAGAGLDRQARAAAGGLVPESPGRLAETTNAVARSFAPEHRGRR